MIRSLILMGAYAGWAGSLPQVDIPTLLLYGERDERAPRSVWEPLQSTIPGAELALIPDVGHMVDMEAPDRVNDEIRTFLRRVAVPEESPRTTSPNHVSFP